MNDNPQRYANAQNPNQGQFKRVLCVCSAGLLRSPTVAWILSNPPFNFNTRSAGSNLSYALIPIDGVLVHWADTVVFVNQENKRQAEKIVGLIGKDVRVLSLPDSFEFREPELVEIAKTELLKVFAPEKGEGEGK